MDAAAIVIKDIRLRLRFSMLASGSSGNAALLETDGFGLLIDAGLGPRQLSNRLSTVGASWQKVNAVILTHTHSDHWKDRTFETLRRHQIPLYCHPEHQPPLRNYSLSFVKLEQAKLVRHYEASQPFRLSNSLHCLALELHHDSGPTFGFRLELAPDLFGSAGAIGYLADLGCWTEAQAQALANVDILALEFNHDVEMERTSGRHWELIQRVLGDHGHLSNRQAAQFLHAILDRSSPGLLQHLVQTHLSRECNHPSIAQAVAQDVLAARSPHTKLHTAQQNCPGPVLTLEYANGSTQNGAASDSVAAGLARSASEERRTPSLALRANRPTE
ncbi:MAG TPA: MBL fold metallo-hydrolase [Gemmataceae bacterium]|nr:MBL fold metallo-hydrolase [Gemmataceae bacterium]